MRMNKIGGNLFFPLTQWWVVVFWAMPELMQKPFRILLLLFTFFVSFYIKVPTSRKVLVLLISGMLIWISLQGAFQTSVVNVLLSTFFVTIVPYIYRPFTMRQLKLARRIVCFCCGAMFVQMLYFTASDGRPSLGYELNWSGAYLFLFFLYNDLLKIKIGKLFVVAASMVLLSRLLVLSLIIFYFVRCCKRYFNKPKLHWGIVYSLILIVYLSANVWLLANGEFLETSSSDRDRLTTLNDDSNRSRFLINATVLDGIFERHDPNFLWGYGEISAGANPKYSYNYHLMPHNEFLDSIAEFGYITTIIFLIFSISLFNRYFSWRMYDYYLPLVVYTMILWARYMIVPSPEMAFIIFLILAKSKEYESGKLQPSTHCR